MNPDDITRVCEAADMIVLRLCVHKGRGRQCLRAESPRTAPRAGHVAERGGA